MATPIPEATSMPTIAAANTTRIATNASQGALLASKREMPGAT